MHAPRVAAAALSGWISRDDRRAAVADAAAGTIDRCIPACETIPLKQFVAITERRAAQAGDEQLGWTLGTQYDLRKLAPIYSALQSAPTLEAALLLLADFFMLMQDASELTLSRDQDSATISYRILDPEIWPRHQDAIFTLGIVVQLLWLANGVNCDKVQMGIECADVSVAGRLAQRSGVDCAAGADSNWLRFPAALLAMRMPDALPIRHAELQALNRALVGKRRATSVEDRVRLLIYRQLGDQPISQESIARQLGMSSRTLRRQLAASTTSFQDLVDHCRLRQAAHEFRVRRHVSIAQTALRLGYSEHSTFTRAFSRWSGMPPQSFIRSFAPG